MLPNCTGLFKSGCAGWIAALVCGSMALPPPVEAAGDGDEKQSSELEQAAQIGLIGLYRPAEDAKATWTLTSLASQGSFSGNRADWLESGTELLYRATPAVYLGGRVETREREHDTDVLYSVLVSQMLSRTIEWHAAATVVSDPVFSAEEAYAAGMAWRTGRQLSLLLDYSRLNFVTGSIDQYKSGATVWFTERNFLTGRYTYGRAFGEANFEGYLLRLDFGVSNRFRAALSAVHGSDPEKDIGSSGVIVTQADTYTAYGHWTLLPSLELILGAEYEDRENIYTRSTGAVGFSLRF